MECLGEDVTSSWINAGEGNVLCRDIDLKVYTQRKRRLRKNHVNTSNLG